MRARPRRALQAPFGVRVARVAVPAVAAGAAITTVAVTAWPISSVEAAPAPVTSAASPSADAAVQRAAQAQRADRGDTRPALSDADEKAVLVEQAQREAVERQVKAVERRAKAAKAAKKAAAKKAAAAKAEKLADSVIGSRYTTAAVKLRTDPSKKADSVDVVDAAKKLKVTDTVEKGYRLVVVDGKGRWVTDEYLSKKKPSPEEAAGISDASCSTSSGIESGLVSNGRRVYRAMCAAFPEVSSFGGRRGGDGGFHGSGRAVDAMISDSGAGWRLANWLRDNASELGVSEVIYSQKIWTVQRSGEGWRGMSDRGSSTANHYDHVHVSVF
ncbi:MAG TPA: SH3 domain-containing protein [Microlunatus sp.]|nr:SH3 domain-containing protein [Microlunatus sp.]